eukprot:2500311-Prymnesium_polylepis.2
MAMLDHPCCSQLASRRAPMSCRAYAASDSNRCRIHTGLWRASTRWTNDFTPLYSLVEIETTSVPIPVRQAGAMWVCLDG